MQACEQCMYFEYDEELDEYSCVKEDGIDEDDMYRMIAGKERQCPFFRAGDEYQIVKHQM
ncbi:MAG: hypothetical protein IK115_13630 [Lachnospiraceae bacterium]|nr:hypothetical protein [Lachnospiraceae bacterium]